MTFTFTPSSADWLGILPELILVCVTLLLMLVDLVLPHEGPRSKETGPENYVVLPIVALLGVIGAFAATIYLFQTETLKTVFENMVGTDQGTLYAFLIILTASALGLLLSPSYLKRLNLVHQGEYYALFLLATVGMMLLASATSFLTVFIGIEMLSLALYILCAFVGRRRASQESGMKYFLLSSFASAFLLYGIAMTYAATGHTTFAGVNAFLQTHHAQTETLLLIAMGLLTVGFAFKISAIPFQAWTPDVYQGAPAPVTAFMSVGTKAAALIAFARVFAITLVPVHDSWAYMIEAIAILTIVGGNVLALVQTNVKRLLAYSSIAHAGYLLIGIVVGGAQGVAAILFYLFCYAFMNVGAFGVLSLLEHVDNSGSNASDLRGLWYRNPWGAGLLAFFLLALAGFPPMAGFAAKYSIFLAALRGGHPELLIIGVLASILGMYYYLRVIATMFMEHAESAEVPTPPAPLGVPLPRERVATSSLSRGGTAVAVRPFSGRLTSGKLVSGKLADEALAPVTPAAVLGERPVGALNGFAYVALIIAALGTLAMGTILPFWLVDLATTAAQSMMH